ncbi:MAG: carbohydrate ABC transporter permease [Lachnospiraceae bacterium]|nr:carbohydrate ABC transporter permease [Lachnospiraceae bacterium]
MKSKINILKIGKWLLSAVLFLIFFIPFYWMALTSLETTAQTLQTPPLFFVLKPQFENFITAFNAIDYLHYFKNSVVVTAGVLIIQMVTVVPAAYAFARYEFKGKGLLFGMVLATTMIPSQLVFLPVFLILSKMGLINTYWSLILPQAASAFGIFMLRQNFMQVPKDLIEAARMDKAGEFKIVFQIMIPMARSTIVTLALLTFISTWNDYFWVKVLTTNETVRTLSMGMTMLREVESGLVSNNIVMAGNLIMLVPVLIAFVLAQKQILKAFAYTGVK